MPSVLFIGPNAVKPYLGPSTAVYNMLLGFTRNYKELEKSNIDLILWSVGDHYSRDCGKIKIIGVPLTRLLTLTGELQYLLKMKSISDVSIIHTNDIYSIPAGFIKNIPIILTLHGMLWREKKFEGSLYKQIYYNLGTWRFKTYYNLLSYFIAISPYVIDELRKLGLDISKALIIENPVNEAFFNIRKNDSNVILYPARINSMKNQLGFLKALRLVREELKEYKVMFAGSGDMNYIRLLKNYVRKNNIDNVYFLGRIPYNDLLNFYSRASMVVLVSYQETMPMSVAEALASGTPVIASNVGGIPYMVDNYETGILVNPSDQKSIAEAIITLIDDRKLRNYMGVEARKRAKGRWKAEIVSRRLIRLYASILN